MLLPHCGGIHVLTFSPDGKTLAVTSCSTPGCSNQETRFWDAATGKPRGKPLSDFLSRGLAPAFSPDGKTLLSGGFGPNAQLWDVATGEPRGGPMPHKGRVEAVAFSPDGKTIATLADDPDNAVKNPVGGADPKVYTLTQSY